MRRTQIKPRCTPHPLTRFTTRMRRGATSTEYIMIMVFVVLPIAAMMKTVLLPMIRIYGTRVTSMMGLPFP